MSNARYQCNNLRPARQRVKRLINDRASTRYRREALPIPFDATRQPCLREIRSRIIQDTSRIGLFTKLNTAKARLALANKGSAMHAHISKELATGSRESSSMPQV